jgi:L-serine/L-threonine ammonia-lyase
VQVSGSQWSEAHAAAGALASSCGGALIHPYEGVCTWEGHASLVTETAAQLPHAAAGLPGAAAAALAAGGAPGAMVASVGGGGLLMGVLMGAERVGWRDETCLVAAETRGADCLAQALAADALVTLPGTAHSFDATLPLVKKGTTLLSF